MGDLNISLPIKEFELVDKDGVAVNIPLATKDLSTPLNTQAALLSDLEAEINGLPEAGGGGNDNRLAQWINGIIDAPKEFWSGITEIGTYGCTNRINLESLHLPSGITLNNNCFYNNPKLKTVILEDGLSTIPKQCFYMCRGMEYMDVPASVVNILDQGFRFNGSSSMTSTTLTIRFRSKTPPAIGNSIFPTDDTLFYIEVPKGCLEAYKTDTNWSIYDVDNGGPATFVEYEEAPNE